MRYLLLLCALVALTPSGAAQPRHDGVFAYSSPLCGVTYVTSQRVPAYPHPRASGAPSRHVDASRRVEGNDRSDDLVVVQRPGRLVARRDVLLQEWGYYDSDRAARGELRIPRGTAIEVMGTIGEASTIWRMNGTVYVSMWGVPADASSLNRADFTAESFPVVERWVRLRPRGSAPAAWLNTSGPGVRAGYDDSEIICD